MEQADEEVFIVEECPLLAGQVELGKFHTQFVVNVLKRKVGGLVNRILNSIELKDIKQFIIY